MRSGGAMHTPPDLAYPLADGRGLVTQRLNDETFPDVFVFAGDRRLPIGSARDARTGS